jgi:Family of unknown function (DUF6152)
MRTKVLLSAAALMGLLARPFPVLAHHSFNAEFDGNRPITLKGTVVKMEWINPHSWITMDVKGPDGKVTTWRVEAGAPNAMFRRGFRRDSLPPGTEIIVEGFMAKQMSNTANGRDLTFPDGKKLFMGSSGTGAPDDDKRGPQ